MEQSKSASDDYVHKVLDAYRKTPGTTGQVRRPDRLLAEQLFERGIPLAKVENALLLAAARRIFRTADAPPLATVRSLAYFVPVIDEVVDTEIPDEYFQHARQKLQRHL
jgi:hypothetical protein